MSRYVRSARPRELGARVLAENRRLVRLDDGGQEPVELRVVLAKARIEIGDERVVPLAAVAEEPVGAAPLVLQRRRSLEEREPAANRLEVAGVELLLLHQHLFAHADLAEVVQQAGVAELAELRRRVKRVPR